jgi:hypothetical protein
MSSQESAVPLSAVGLRLTDEVGQGVLDRVAAGDLAASAALDQHVAAVRAALSECPPGETGTARLAGEAAGRAGRSQPTRPHHARRSGAVTRSAAGQARCLDTPFADSARCTDEAPPLQLLLHYACGFVEAAVRADWWPGENDAAAYAFEIEAVRLAAVCQLIRQAEATAALPPDLS